MKTDRKKVHDMGDNIQPFGGRKVKSQGHQGA